MSLRKLNVLDRYGDIFPLILTQQIRYNNNDYWISFGHNNYNNLDNNTLNAKKKITHKSNLQRMWRNLVFRLKTICCDHDIT